jgi:hypothetical protein
VYSEADFDKIAEYEARQREQCVAEPPPGWQTWKEIAAVLGEEEWIVSNALAVFRDERPEGFVRVADFRGKKGKNREGAFATVFYHDPEAFKAWVVGRDLRALARSALNKLKTVKPSRAREAKMFLWFILTKPAYGLSRPDPGEDVFPAKTFQRFLHESPVGLVLEPREGMSTDKILAWAGQAGLVMKEKSYRQRDANGQDTNKIKLPRVLYEAQKQAGVQSQPGGQGKRARWYLPGPVTITVEDVEAAAVRKRRPPVTISSGIETLAAAEQDRPRKQVGRPVKYPKALEMALRLFAESKDPNPKKIHRQCKDACKEEPVPDFDSFMRTIQRAKKKASKAAPR